MIEEELRTRILQRYDIEEFCEVLEVGVEDILDMFLDRVYNKLSALEINDPEGFTDEDPPEEEEIEPTTDL